MKKIRTVLGDIEPQKLGFTHCHEHILIEKDKSAEVSGVLLIDEPVKSIMELIEYKAAGGGAVVDAQPVMSGRMAGMLAEASFRSGVNIIASTGFHKTVFYYEDSYMFSQSEDEIARLYISEIEEGMLDSREKDFAKTDIKAGIIKVAVDSGGIYADSIYEKLHSAAAEAQKRTGAAVMCHVEQGANAVEIADFYAKRGVDPKRLWLAHMDRAEADLGIHKEILSCGCYMEYDTIAREKYHSDEREREIILEMLAAGYQKQLLLGLDVTRARLKSYGGGVGLDYIIKTFLPYLKAAGVSEAQIARMTLQNPAAAIETEFENN